MITMGPILSLHSPPVGNSDHSPTDTDRKAPRNARQRPGSRPGGSHGLALTPWAGKSRELSDCESQSTRTVGMKGPLIRGPKFQSTELVGMLCQVSVFCHLHDMSPLSTSLQLPPRRAPAFSLSLAVLGLLQLRPLEALHGKPRMPHELSQRNMDLKSMDLVGPMIKPCVKPSGRPQCIALLSRILSRDPQSKEDAWRQGSGLGDPRSPMDRPEAMIGIVLGLWFKVHQVQLYIASGIGRPSRAPQHAGIPLLHMRGGVSMPNAT